MEHGCSSRKLSDQITLVDVLLRRAEQQPHQCAFTFLSSDDESSFSVTYAELDRRARAVAAYLQELQAKGERALLLYPTGLDFLSAFLGCLYAGVIAVKVFPLRNRKHMPRLEAIAREADARFILTLSDLSTRIKDWARDTIKSDRVRLICTDNTPSQLANEWSHPGVRLSDLAFLQYTSGSTSVPKGVMVSHGNIVANCAAMRDRFRLSEESVSVTWVPHFHDMGLLDGLLQPLLTGFPGYLMTPTAFLQKPFRWLEAISRYRGTHSMAPNFAYDLCVERISPEERATLDLSSWQNSINGAEPVQPATLKRFWETFASCGLRLTALLPAYGLAECTLAVSGGTVDAEPITQIVDAAAFELLRVEPPRSEIATVREVVSCGAPVSGLQVAIVHPETRKRCAADEVGEIWVAGPSVAQGYWQRPVETEEIFNARIVDSDEGPFLRTGDLGFLREDGELFVTGRRKDVIVVAGANHYPQDIEVTVKSAHPSLRAVTCAAFGLERAGEERLVVVSEVERSERKDLDEVGLFEAVSKAILSEHDLALETLVLIRPGSIPKTSSGKIQRSACKQQYLEEQLAVLTQHTRPRVPVSVDKQTTPATQTEAAVRAWLRNRLSVLAAIEPWRMNDAKPFAEFGLVSRDAVGLSGELETWLGRSLPAALLYEYPTIDALTAFLCGTTPPSLIPSPQVEIDQHEDIAIIGMACRFPGADSPAAFWRLLRDGVDAISEIPTTRQELTAFEGGPFSNLTRGAETQHGGFLRNVDSFDAAFFGIAPREAETMDPQQRLLLEVSWEALENAGIAPLRLATSDTGVFIGISTGDYARLLARAGVTAYASTGNAFSIAANRLSYFLNLRGPSLAIDTACSSSLVAVHQACQSLRRGECQVALAGGVNLILASETTATLAQAGMLSPESRCKTFDATADGYVRGEGCGVIVLKRFSNAQTDGDRILALIKGTAVNQDGRSNGLTAPNGAAQQSVITKALIDARIAPEAVSYVEAHGTGTALGDPIEISALQGVLTPGREPSHICRIGSVKTNIGHLEAAAGIAGLIKVTLALQHGEIPPHLHLREVNPHIQLRGTPFSIPTARETWSASTGPRVAGVSSFGFGGTNAHAILQEAPAVSTAPAITEKLRTQRVLTLSAREESTLRDLANAYRQHLLQHPELNPAALCFTANTCRAHFEHRLAVCGESIDDFSSALTAFLDARPTADVFHGQVRGMALPKVAFLFTGQGSQYANMGRSLYETEPQFRRIIDECAETLRPHLPQSLLAVMYPADNDATLLNETMYSQPALFAVGYALAKLWQSWGVQPDVLMGHSLGEYIAACLAGVFCLEDALTLVAARGRLMQELPSRGAMAAVFTDEDTVKSAIESHADFVAIAAVNGPRNVVISGLADAVLEITQRLHAAGVQSQMLTVSHAFHSPLIAPMLAEFGALAAQVAMSPPQIPIISTLTGALADSTMATADYWVRQTRQPVRFAAAVAVLNETNSKVAIEVGPQPVLLGIARTVLSDSMLTWIASLRKEETNEQTLKAALAQLYVAGVPVDWTTVARVPAPQKIELPTYPFRRQRHWIEPPLVPFLAGQQVGHPLLGKKLTLADPPGSHVFTVLLDTNRPRYLADHKIEAAEVFPAAGYFEMALSAARLLGVEGGVEIRHVTFEKPLILADSQPVEVQTHFVACESSGWRFTIYSRILGSDRKRDWTCHVSGEIHALLSKNTLSPVSLADVQARCPSLRDGKDFYSERLSQGNEWGSTFQGIQQVWRGEGEVLAEIVTPEGILSELKNYQAHPALLDACGQLLAAGLANPPFGAFVGQSVQSFRLYTPLRGGRFWSHAVLDRDDAQSRSVRGNVTIRDIDGGVVCEILGLEFAFLQQAAQSERNVKSWLHEVIWQAVEPFPLADRQAPKRWLIVDKQKHLGNALAVILRSHGRDVLEIFAENEVEKQITALQLPPDHIVYFAADVEASVVSSAEQELQQVQDSLTTVSRLVDALKKGSVSQQRKLWIVTQEAWVISHEHATEKARPGMASLWGLGRALALEHADLWGGLIDLDSTVDVRTIGEQLLSVLLNSAGEDQIALRNGSLHVARLRRYRTLTEQLPPRFRQDATYLITGGLGGLGLHMAKWMVRHGARRLVLLGRSGLPARKLWSSVAPASRDGRRIQSIRDLEAEGVSIHLVQLDIADEVAFSHWLDDFRNEGWPPLRGVIHAAGTVQKRMLSELSAEEWREQLRAKVAGAYLLDRYLSSEQLDCFVLFSSSSAILSSPGLDAYAAANAYLDGLAQSRRIRGLPALSINWGAWGDVGMVADQVKEEGAPQLVHGTELITPEQGTTLAAQVWQVGMAQVAILPIDWTTWRDHYPTAAAIPLLKELVADDIEAASITSRVVGFDLHSLVGLETAAVAEKLKDWLVPQISQVLKLSPNEVNCERPLNTLGLDSLMALELRGRILHGVGLLLSTVDLIRGPSISELAAHLAGLLVNSSQTPKSDEYPRVQAMQESTTVYPLSYGQKAQWLLHQVFPESAAYHVAFAARVRSLIDREAMQRAVLALVQRHTALRTVYRVNEGAVTQHIFSQGAVDFVQSQVDGLSEVQVKRAVEQAYRQPFDLAEGPLLRLRVFTIKPDDHILLLVAHHIACDGWSLWILLDELKTLYQSELTGDGAKLTGLPWTFLDAVRWQEELLTGPAGQRLWNFWREQLSDELPVLDLPTDRPRPPVQTNRGASSHFVFNDDLTVRLKEFSQTAGVTLYTVLLTAFQVFLHRLSQQEDIVVGSPAAGRTQTEFAGIVGNFVNPLVLRTDLAGKPDFHTVVTRTRESVLNAMAHQDFPFLLLVERLQPKRDPSRSPLFQANFVLQRPQQAGGIVDLMVASGQEAARSWGALTLEPFELVQQEGQFDITLEIVETAHRLHGLFKCNADLFDQETVVRFSRQFETLLAAALAEPHCMVSQLPLLSRSDQETALHRLNGVAVNNAREVRISELFEAQVSRTPDAIAVICGDEQLTFASLNSRANQLAHRLIALGAGPGKLVGLAVERSLDLVIGLYGILKAGAAYVPIDPRYPRDRLTLMLEIARPAFVLTQKKLVTNLPASNTLCLDDPDLRLVNEPTINPRPEATSDDLIYVIFTSGSTGVPKMTGVYHRSFVSLVQWYLSEFTFVAADRNLVVTSLSFDLTQKNYFAPLLVGGSLSLAPDEGFDPTRISTLIAEHHVSLLNCTPSAFYPLVQQEERTPRNLESLRYVFLGGEPISMARVRPWLKALETHATLVNTYGPTECTDVVSFFVVREPRAYIEKSIPIGGRSADARLLVLSEGYRLLPTGLSGELYIGGECVGVGYLNDPAKTAENFLPDPFSVSPGARLYKTGDVVRYLSDSTLEFMGRADQQVKVRGYRIDLGEIESALAKIPEVRESVVVAREDQLGYARLIAYVVGHESERSSSLSIAALRLHLGASLPDYMVPTMVIPLKTFPLTPSGKLDRHALPEPNGAHAQIDRPYVAPETVIESIVCQIWEQVLEIEHVGVHDNFFELGGHSLLMVECHVRLQNALRREFPIVDLFAHPTVHAFSNHFSSGPEKATTPTMGNDRAKVRSNRAVGIRQRSQARREHREQSLVPEDTHG